MNEDVGELAMNLLISKIAKCARVINTIFRISKLEQHSWRQRHPVRSCL